MIEHYGQDILERTGPLYQDIRKWAEDRKDVTIIGGWAVFERVESGYAMQSRDVDIVLHSEDALKDLNNKVPQWDLRWRTNRRSRFPDAHFSDEATTAYRLDVFTTKSNDTWESRFGRMGAGNIKSAPRQLVPEVNWLVKDKLDTIHKRANLQDGPDKRAKDLIDIYHLVFHNLDRILPRAVIKAVDAEARTKARPFMEEAERIRPTYRDKLGVLDEWLQA